MVIVIVALSAVFTICAVLLLLLKRDIRLLGQSLHTIKQSDSNMKLTTETFDKDICVLCDTVNEVLDKQRQLVITSEKSNREFRQAITNISHDLRTPLTSAVGYLQMLKSGQTSPQKTMEYFGIIEYRLMSLSKLMNELFEYTQIEEGRLEVTIERVNICNVIRDCISTFYEDFMEKNFEVRIDIPDVPVYVFCDESLIKRVIQNLLQNVLLHGMQLFLLTIKENTMLFHNKVPDIETIDTGKLFDRFYTSDVSRSGGTTGLGLAIAKELVQNMDGEIKAYRADDMLGISVNLRSGV